MKDDPSISGKKTVEESVVESSWMWVDGVFQDGLNMSNKPQLPVPVIVALRKMGQDISDLSFHG